MKKYKVQVAMSYWHTIEVQAENKEEAGDMAFDLFDISKARQGEGDVYDVEIIEGETE